MEKEDEKIESEYTQELQNLHQDRTISDEERKKKECLLLKKKESELDKLYKDFHEEIEELILKCPNKKIGLT